jgi:hypothetical protein
MALIFRLRKTGFLFFLAVSFQIARAQDGIAVHNYALNRPGVVMIKTVYSAKVSVNKMRMDERAFYQLLDKIQKADTAGAVFSQEQKLDIVLRIMNNYPARFFKKSLETIEEKQEITATGTGFLITGDGYHLIDRDNAFIRRQFILTAFQEITQAHINAFESSWAATFNEQQKNLLNNTYASLYSKLFPMTLSDLQKTVYVVYRVDSNNTETTETRAANIIIKGSPMPGKDVAILKIDGDTTLPDLKMADKDLPLVGEQLFVYGYPGPVTNNDFVSAVSAIEPTLTTGIVSAIKKSVNGWPVIQMDANINHGSSGGPVCNSEGAVVGLTTFGSLENSGSLAAGLNFSIPISILYEFMDSAGIEHSVSRSTSLFSEGLNYFEKCYFGKAIRDFQEVKKINAHYPTLDHYILACRQNIAAKKDIQSIRDRYIWIVILAILLLLVIYLIVRKKFFS